MNAKKCRVCGDQATGFNYDGLSCESCKVFFCRNSAKIEILKCDFVGNCLISVSTRKQCPKCRLIKCFSIGMKRKCLKNKENDSIQNGIEQIVEFSILKYMSDYDLKQITKYVSNNQNDALQLQPKSRLPLELNKFELERICEAQNAICVFRNEHDAPIVKFAQNYDDLTDMSLSYIKKTINFCQHFAAFNTLQNDDQMLILKPFCWDLLGIWFVFQCDTKNRGMLMFTDESETETIFISQDLGLQYYKDQEMLNNMIQYTYSLHDAMENDVTIRDLLSAMLLFKHTENLTCPENIRYHYHLYSMLLLRYLQQKCQNKKEGNRKYLSLLRLVDNLEVVKKFKKDLAIEFGIEKFPPIILELYDLV